MGARLCPACGVRLLMREWTVGPGRPDWQVPLHFSWKGEPCWVADILLSDAEGVVRIRAEGGERLRLAAHP